jgi:tRNA threonylcarbamoyladenosine biosynthesis protein TsaB
MRLLAVETSTRRLSAALWIDGDCRERVVDSMTGGSEWLLPAIRALLAEAGLQLADLDGLAFGRGPGAFTGLRLGVAAVQGLACGLELPVAGICSLEALAQASGETRVVACLDARMDEVYLAAYAEGREVIAPLVVPPSQAPMPEGDGWIGCGDGYARHGALLPVPVRVRADVLPTAVAVASLAAGRWSPPSHVRVEDLLPLYIRDKVALTTVERLARGGVR